MLILGIETSCDETSCALVEDGKKILSDAIATSAEIHKKTGGIIPENAARKQVEFMLPVIEEALSSSHKELSDIYAIAVTSGPGLIGSLLVGVETAKTMATISKKPLVPVNHLVGHLYATWLETENPPQFPALGVVVSGGHTDIVLMKAHGKFEWVGGTRDDAAGEAFDKTARLLGLPYPGGPAISKASARYREKNKGAKLELFPRPLIDSTDFDFSFSGLKTAVLREVEGKKLTEADVDRYAAEVEEAIVMLLLTKVKKACVRFNPKSLIIAGGVSANSLFRHNLEASFGPTKKDQPSLHIPEIKHCTDNASYIAACAFYNYQPLSPNKVQVNPNLGITD